MEKKKSVEELLMDLKSEIAMKLFQKDPKGIREMVAEMIKDEEKDCPTCDKRDECILYAIHHGGLLSKKEIKMN